MNCRKLDDSNPVKFLLALLRDQLILVFSAIACIYDTKCIAYSLCKMNVDDLTLYFNLILCFSFCRHRRRDQENRSDDRVQGRRDQMGRTIHPSYKVNLLTKHNCIRPNQMGLKLNHSHCSIQQFGSSCSRFTLDSLEQISPC